MLLDNRIKFTLLEFLTVSFCVLEIIALLFCKLTEVALSVLRHASQSFQCFSFQHKGRIIATTTSSSEDNIPW